MRACDYMTFERSPAVARLARIEALLRAESLTVLQLSERLHVSKKTAQTYKQHLAPHLYIARWDTSRPGQPAPAFAWGQRKDAKRPVPMTAKEKGAAYRKRLRQKRPEAWIAKANRERAARLRPRRDALVAAFFGAAA